MGKKIFSMLIAMVMVLSLFAGCVQELDESALADKGYVLNPGENGWVQDPANNGWVQDPANNGWVQDPANNGWVQDPANNGWVHDPANNGWISSEDYIAGPKMVGKVIHWVPGVQAANVSYELDLAGETDYKVILGDKLLEEYVDYTYDSESKLFEILGTTLYDLELGLGEHIGYVFTAGGCEQFKVIVIASATEEGSTIPLKTINDINLSAIETATITEPIAGLADFFITEVSTDMGHYNYVEVFNNTTSTYNLKDHRIVFANTTAQTKSGQFDVNGVFDYPLGAASAAYIYQDFEIPALSSAIIWIVNTTPWNVASNKLSEVEGAQGMILGDGEENLSVAKFKDVYGLDESTLVFPARTNYMIGRSDYSDDISGSDGWGTAVMKSSSNWWKDINSSTPDRAIQIQKMNESMVFETEDGKFYTLEMDVLNREEDIYADGKLDANDVLVTNPNIAIGGKNREFIHAVFVKRIYVTSPTDLTPTGQVLTTADGYDLYNCNTANYNTLFTSGFVTPVATAIVYPDLAMNDAGEEAAAKWGTSYKTFAMQYQAPAAGEHMSKFIPLEGDRAKYEALYEGNAYVLSGLGQEFAGYGANAEVKVPESNVYPTDYLAQNHNTAGRVTAMMLPTVQEENQ